MSGLFWNKVNKNGPIVRRGLGACWEWTGYTGPRGYGEARIKRKTIRTHRVSFEIHFGRIPHGLWVLHRCDNPKCVNPDHLFLGTVKDNVKDCVSKGRNRWPVKFGTHHPRARLGPEAINFIKSSGLSCGELAKKLGVNRSTVWRAKIGRTYCVNASYLEQAK